MRLKSTIVKPKVTVVIPVYNVEKYLSKCLDSVEQQTLKEIEVVCIDDGSPDNSINILRDYANRYSNIKIIRQENGGLSAARNTGIKYASGDYIHFLDSDDTIKQNAYEELYSRAAKDDLDILFFDAEPIYETTDLKKKYPWYKTGYSSKKGDNEIMIGRDFYINSVNAGTFRVSACLYLIKASFIRQKNLVFKEGIVHEDNLFTNICVMQAERVGYIDFPFLNRLVRAGSISVSYVEFRHAYGYFASFIGLYHFINREIQDEALENAAYKKMSELIVSAQYSYEMITSIGQKNLYLDLPEKESVLFYLLVVDPFALNKNNKFQKEQIENLIHKVESHQIDAKTVLLLRESQGISKRKVWHVSKNVRGILPLIPAPIRKAGKKIIAKLGWGVF